MVKQESRQDDEALSFSPQQANVREWSGGAVMKRQRQHSSPKKDAKESSSATSLESTAPNNAEGPSGESKLTPVELKKARQEHFNNRYCYGNFDRLLWCAVRTWPKMFEDKDWILSGEGLNSKRFNDFVGKFPASFCTNFGPISNHTLSFSTKFPDNVWFRRENYVLESDELLETVEEEFDVILALSITKWIHLNFGDDGLRRFFRRAFNQLLPGGRFILEPQPFASYRKRAKMTEKLKATYAAIEFKPEDFEMYLIEEVGFESVEHLGAPCAKTKGFERPIDVYLKKPPRFLERAVKNGE
ncbi:Bicoid-interacting protein 3 [Ostertagia ostertagi]